MPDEATEAPAVEQDTPTAVTEPEAPAEDTPEVSTEPEVDYQKRYDDLRPQFDQQAQFLSALQGRQGDEAQKSAYAQLGLELAEEESDDTYLDSDARLEKLETQIQERDKQAQQEREFQQEAVWIQDAVGEVQKAEGRDLTPEERDIIVGFAVANRLEDDQPDIEGGHERLKAIYSAAQKRLISSKRAPKPPSGAAGEPTIDTSTLEGRRQAIRAIAESHEAAES